MLLLVLALAFVLTGRAQDCDSLRGIFRVYGTPSGLVDTPAPAGYKPVYISHYGRHGSRFHGDPALVLGPRDSLLAARGRGTLTALGEAMLSRLEAVAAASDGLWYELTAIGEREHREIAGRMVRRFAPVFRPGKRIDAFSSIRTRCLVSMGCAASEISARVPGIRIYLHTGKKYLPLLKNETLLPEARRWFNPRIAALTDSLGDWTACLRRLYTDAPGEGRAATALAINFWNSWAEAPCIDGEGFEILDWLSIDELRALGRSADMNLPLKCLRSDRFGQARVESQRALLTDMTERADDALSRGDVAATLRYGHDANLVGLAGLMNLCGFEGVYSLDRFPDPRWRSADRIPMASNLQLVFYRKPSSGSVLVKFLYNEREVLLSGLAAVTGPYYDWAEVKTYWK